MARGLSIASVIIGLVGSLTSAYLFTIGEISFEKMFWIMIGLIFFVIISVYQDIDELRWEQKRLNEKLKIYNRLNKLENKVFK